MSVQAGVWNFDGKPADRDLLEKLSDAVAQHGPDAEKTILLGPVGMLYRPFHTTLESRLEHQPRVSARGYVMTWDGRLDNRDELIPHFWDELTEQTDVAIAMAAFEKWGPDCFRKLVGDWALAIWDPTEKTLILARDYVAIRHLYYYKTHEKIIWCTHLAPIVVLSGTQFTLNDEYIAGFLALWPEAHLTPYREIHSVPPGKFVCICRASTTIHSYWTFDPKRQIRYKTDAEYEEHFRHVFRQAVRRRLRSDSPILAELSGGLDSSSIVCMADDILAKGTREAPRLDTLSLYDTHEPGGDERPYFTRIEEKRGRRGFHFDSAQYESCFAFDYPDEFHAIPGSIESKKGAEEDFQLLIRSREYSVLLSGIGGDEFMGGVPDPRVQLADLLVQFRLKRFAQQIMAWSLAKRRPLVQVLFDALLTLVPAALRAHVVGRAKVPPWIDQRFAREHRIGLRQLGPQESFGFWLPSRKSYAQTVCLMGHELNYFQPNRGVEERYPYLDRDLVEFILSIPADQMIRPGQRRSLMRRSLASLVPSEILFRKTKATTSRRFMAAFAAQREGLEKLLEEPLSERWGYMRKGQFQEALHAAKNGNAPQLVRMVKGIALELWLRDLVCRRIICGKVNPSKSLLNGLASSEYDAFSGSAKAE